MDNALEDTEITPGQILVVSPRRFTLSILQMIYIQSRNAMLLVKPSLPG